MDFNFIAVMKQPNGRKADHWRIYFNGGDVFVIQVFGISAK